RGSATDMSDADFSISPMPQDLEVEEACPDYIRLRWDEVDGATGYEIFLLGEKYMEPVGTSPMPTFDFPTTDPSNDHWFAVRALGEEGLASERTNAIFYNGGLLACPLQNDMNVEQILSPGSGLAFACQGVVNESLPVRVVNGGLSDQTDVMVAYQVDDEPVVMEPLGMTLPAGESTIYTFTEPLVINTSGDHTIRAWTIIPNDAYLANDTSSVAFDLILLSGNVQEPMVIETFESGTFPPSDWNLLNEDDSNTWEQTSAIQSDGNFGGMMTLDNFSYASAETNPKFDFMYTYPIDLTNAPEDIGLSFDLAYTQYQSGGVLFSDGLRIELSIDCGLSFPIVVYDKFGDALNTVPNQAATFAPGSADDWRREFVDLSDYIGSEIMIKFVNVSGYGNNIYIDNVNVSTQAPPEPPTAMFNASALEICRFGSVTFENMTQGFGITYFWDFGDGAFPPSSSLPGPHTINFAQSGTITVSLLAVSDLGNSTTSVEITVLDEPQPNFEFTPDATTVTFTNTSMASSGATYDWDFGDNNTSTDENPIHTYAEPGIYTVTLLVTDECGTETITAEVTVSTTSVEETQLAFDLLVSPNPNSGNFDLVINSSETERLDWNLFNLQGQSLTRGQLTTSLGTTHQAISVGHLAAGIYLMKVNNDKGFKTMKVVIF
ncbi:MAG: PKD domain-containing protein, partial [Bacteroidota bacterium]